LQQAKGRREHHCFLIEGTHLVQEALATDWPIQAICYTPDWEAKEKDGMPPIPKRVRQEVVSPEVLSALATTQTPSGVVAVGEQVSREWMTSSFQVGIALQRVQDPGNVGALIRNAVAAGADQIWLSEDSVDPEHPKVLRSSAGQWFRRPPRPVSDLLELVKFCQRHQIQVLAAAARQGSQTLYWDLDLTKPTLFVLGNEGAGLSAQLVAQADGVIQIPMAAGVESLNVAMTGGLLLYEAWRQRRDL
jgi:TrmH family RNA methyltransferase